ncbi:unnamed protein product, partial [Sphagnum balticum]
MPASAASASAAQANSRQAKSLSDDQMTAIPAMPETVDRLQTPRFKRTLRLSNEQLQMLKLRPGMNEMQFSVTTKFQGTSWSTCHVHLYKWSDKIVVSDIDGTIT